MLTLNLDPFLQEIGISCAICDDTYVPLHNHNFLELMYVLSGKAVHTVEGEVTMVEKGDYYVIDYRTAHSYKPVGKDPFRVFNCLFVPAFIDPALSSTQSFNDVMKHYLIRMSKKEKNTARPIYRFHDKNGEVEKLLFRMVEEIEKKEAGYLEVMRAYLVTLIVLSLRSSAFEEKTDAVTDAVKYVAAHYGERISLSDIAARASYSAPYFCKLFREETGMNFLRYVEHIRASEACRLLANTKEKVLHIAETVGYRDMGAFLSMFHRTVGMTPREYRKKIREEIPPHKE